MPNLFQIAILILIVIAIFVLQFGPDSERDDSTSEPTISATIDGVRNSNSASEESTAPAASKEDLQIHAQQLAKQFGSTLKPMLKKHLTENGPVAAINVCKVEAPAVAQKLSEESDWQIKRVSLKPRNIESAQPDTWEREILNEFDQLAKETDQASPLEKSQLDNGEFRFMRAQRVEPPCLICHGKQISPEVKTALDQHFPADQATGYELGEVRGAISMRKTLD